MNLTQPPKIYADIENVGRSKYTGMKLTINPSKNREIKLLEESPLLTPLSKHESPTMGMGTKINQGQRERGY